MSQKIVSDSACLIGLERIGHLEILPSLFTSPILIPPAVQMEFGVMLPWLKVEPIADMGLVLSLEMLVDEGEAEAIALAYQLNTIIILDDQKARKVARNLGVLYKGTISILIKAKQAGIISSVKPLINDLEFNGFYLSQSLKQEAIKLADEA